MGERRSRWIIIGAVVGGLIVITAGVMTGISLAELQEVKRSLRASEIRTSAAALTTDANIASAQNDARQALESARGAQATADTALATGAANTRAIKKVVQAVVTSQGQAGFEPIDASRISTPAFCSGRAAVWTLFGLNC